MSKEQLHLFPKLFSVLPLACIPLHYFGPRARICVVRSHGRTEKTSFVGILDVVVLCRGQMNYQT